MSQNPGAGRLETTPSQTIGPFFGLPGGLPWPDGPEVVPEGTPRAITLRGSLLDGEGKPVPDGLLESWQADEHGRFAHPDDPRDGATGTGSLPGFGRCATDPEGRFWFRTVKPGALPAPGGRTEAPHLDLTVFARGMLQRVVTRVYFPDETSANEADPVLCAVDPRRRGTLVARPEGPDYRFDVRLQGHDETVFFDF